jgi:hypothetical protein
VQNQSKVETRAEGFPEHDLAGLVVTEGLESGDEDEVVPTPGHVDWMGG